MAGRQLAAPLPAASERQTGTFRNTQSQKKKKKKKRPFACCKRLLKQGQQRAQHAAVQAPLVRTLVQAQTTDL